MGYFSAYGEITGAISRFLSINLLKPWENAIQLKFPSLPG